MHGEVIAGRDCGSCNVCCVALTVDEPELQKVQGYRCKHAQPDNSCAIYSARPKTCRDFYCGWRLLKWVKDTLRPDRSGVLIRLHVAKPEHAAGRLGISVSLLNRAALRAEGLAETVAAAVAAGVPVYVHIPGPPGHTSGHARIDEVLAGPVAARDKQRVLDVLREAHKQGKAGPAVPIRLRPRPPA